MKPIYYKSSKGEIVNLISRPYMMLSDTNLFDYAWEYNTKGTIRQKFAGLTKSLVSPTFKIRVTGATPEEFLDNLEALTAIFDGDSFNDSPGRLYCGDYYRECLITSSKKPKVHNVSGATIEFIATSDEANWKSDKLSILSGKALQLGEIAGNAIATAYPNSQDISYSPNEDNTVEVDWEAPGPGFQYFQVDLGDNLEITSLSGLYTWLNRYTNFDVQISDGSRSDDSRTVSATPLVETEAVYVEDFTTITIDAFGSGLLDPSLYMRCYKDYTQIANTKVFVGNEIDVSNYDFVKFFIASEGSGQTSSVDYTVDLMQWETLDSYGATSQAEEIEISYEDIEFRYFRIGGDFTSGVSADAFSIQYEDSEAPPYDLVKSSFTVDNVSVAFNSRTESGAIGFTPIVQGKDGYVYFDAKSILLKNIYCDYVRKGSVIVQGLSDDTWSTIATINDDNFDVDYPDDFYDKMRLKITEDTIVQYFHIYVVSNKIINNDSYAPSNAIIEIVGPINDPVINIGENQYGADVELLSGEFLKIDTKEMTVEKITDDGGSFENVFSSRIKDTFEKVAVGENMCQWRGTIDEIRITLEQARSEPKWN